MARIYVGTYAKYNNGDLTGEWLDAEDYSDRSDFLDACRELHSDEEDPELMFQDHEDCADYVSESHVDAELWDWLELDERDRNVLMLYRDNVDSSGTHEQAQDAFVGTYDSDEDYAENLYDDIGDVPDSLRPYIAWDRVARDLAMDHSFVRHEGETWVFRSC